MERFLAPGVELHMDKGDKIIESPSVARVLLSRASEKEPDREPRCASGAPGGGGLGEYSDSDVRTADDYVPGALTLHRLRHTHTNRSIILWGRIFWTPCIS